MSALKDRYVIPLTDFGFRKLFGSASNKILLKDLVNQVLPEEHQIRTFDYFTIRQPGSNDFLDLSCTSEKGERFVVEIQKAKHNFFNERRSYFSSFPIMKLAEKQEGPAYAIGILDFIFKDHRGEDELLHFVELKNQRCEVFYDKLKFIYIELPKFRKTEEELVTQFDKWLYVFRYLSQLQDRPKALQEKIFQKLFEAAEIAKFTPKEREVYEDSLKYYRDLQNVVDTAREEGKKKGQKEGMLAMARRLKQAGESIAKIRQYTGLSDQEIEPLI